MMVVRQIHAYLSVFVAPTILFFAFTGALQLFSLHEAHGDYQPPALIEKLASVHKDQRFALGHHHAATPKPRAAADSPNGHGQGDWLATKPKAPVADDDTPPPRDMALKWLFLGCAVALAVSTSLGVWMAVTQNRRKLIMLLVFAGGVAAPLAILLL
jgi:hypothetical protein